jgi:hypothetical protein
MVLHINRIERLVGMIITNDRITHTTAKTTKTNAPEMIAANHPQESAPIHRRVACAAQSITTEMAHYSMKKRRDTKNLVDHHAPNRTTEK